jgi:hypothetical protein
MGAIAGRRARSSRQTNTQQAATRNAIEMRRIIACFSRLASALPNRTSCADSDVPENTGVFSTGSVFGDNGVTHMSRSGTSDQRASDSRSCYHGRPADDGGTLRCAGNWLCDGSVTRRYDAGGKSARGALCGAGEAEPCILQRPSSSALLGGLNLSRAVSDRNLSREILHGVCEELIGLVKLGSHTGEGTITATHVDGLSRRESFNFFP